MTYQSIQTAIASEQFCAIGHCFYSDETQSLELNRKSHKFFYFAILLSAVTHLGLSSTLWRDVSFAKTDVTLQQNQFSVEVITAKPSATPAKQAPKEPPVDTQNAPLLSATQLNRTSQKAQAETTPNKKRTIEFNSQPVSQTDSQYDSQPDSQPPEIFIENILSSVRETTEAAAASSQVHREDFIVTDPDLRAQLDALLNEQQRKKQIGELGQIEKQNERYAFKAQGNSQVVRLNGKCYQVQKTDAFSLIDIPWTFMGDCETTKRLDFRTRKLDKEYLNGAKNQ